MESRGKFDYKLDLDFPTLGSNSDFKQNSPPPKANRVSYRDSQENARNASRGRGKKQNWKAVSIEFNNNGQRYQPRGTSRPRFGNNHAVSRPSEDFPPDMAYRGYRSRNRRARGGFAPHHFGRFPSTDSISPLLSPEHKPEQLPPMMAIPYTPNYTTYVQPHSASISPTEPAQVDIKEVIRRQIEYYFSDENLIKDNFMRTNMTKEGFLSIKLIANFNKIRQMNVDIETIIEAIEVSDKLDVVDREIVRPVINPLRWPLSQPLPEFQNIVKNFVHPIVPSLQGNIPLVESYQEINPGEPLVENVQPSGPELSSAVPPMVYQDVEPTSPVAVERVSNYLQRMSLNSSVPVITHYYTKVPQNVIHGQQDLQDVHNFHNKLTYVSS